MSKHKISKEKIKLIAARILREKSKYVPFTVKVSKECALKIVITAQNNKVATAKLLSEILEETFKDI